MQAVGGLSGVEDDNPVRRPNRGRVVPIGYTLEELLPGLLHAV